jgi:hypothetical protein
MKARRAMLSVQYIGGPCLITVDKGMWMAAHIYVVYIFFFFPVNVFVLSRKFYQTTHAIVRSTLQFLVCSFL